MMYLNDFLSPLFRQARQAGRYRQCKTYRSVLGLVYLFSGAYPSLKVMFTPGYLGNLQTFLLNRGCCHNTVAFYMNALRSIHNAAVKAKRLPAAPNLFRGVYTDYVETEKRAVSAGIIARLHAADLSAFPLLDRCRTLFMLCILLQGIAFVDLLHLRKSDLKGNLLTYTRRKTGGQVSVYVIKGARMYLNRLLNNEVKTSYLLPILTRDGEKGYKEYENVLHGYNIQLKKLAKYLDISVNLTSYVARHTWATLAHLNGVDVAILSQAMGHSTEAMTHTYLDSFGHEQLKAANEAVFDAVLRALREETCPDAKEEAPQAQENTAVIYVESDNSAKEKTYLSRAERRRAKKEKRKEEERMKRK
jgi:integrase